jgi:hypothetical protein
MRLTVQQFYVNVADAAQCARLKIPINAKMGASISWQKNGGARLAWNVAVQVVFKEIVKQRKKKQKQTTTNSKRANNNKQQTHRWPTGRLLDASCESLGSR